MGAAIALEDVHKSYGTIPVVRGLSLDVAEGELLCLLGPSGCGKSTTLRMIAGLERVDRGTVRLDGEVVDGPRKHVPPERRNLGMVFQSYAIWPHRSVAENVAWPLQLRGQDKPRRAERVRAALEQVRLGPFADRRPHQLSGGQLQRVALARALVANPRVLLLDEPLSNVDAALRDELRAELAALRARIRVTTVYVTHDQGEALALSDRIAVMRGGAIEQIGTPERIYREPATPFVAGFVGGANLLEGTTQGRRFAVGGTSFELPDGLSGNGTLAVRPEDFALGGEGTPLPLSARLFLGASVEYRLSLGERLLRVVGPPLDARPGDQVSVRILRGRLFA